MSRVAELLDLGEADLERLTGDIGRARLTRTQDRLHLTLEALELDDSEPPKLMRREIDLVAARNIVLTVHDGPVDALRRFDDSLDGETRLGLLDAAGLLSSFVDEVVTGYYQVVEHIERQIDELDQLALSGKARDEVLTQIVALRHRIGFVRRTLAPHRDAIATFARPEMAGRGDGRDAVAGARRPGRGCPRRRPRGCARACSAPMTSTWAACPSTPMT